MLRLGTLNRTGHGKRANSLREAVTRLEAFNLTTVIARIRKAVAVSELAAEVLQPFDALGIINHTVRGRLHDAREHGPETLLARARELGAAGKTGAQILALFWGVRSPPRRTVTKANHCACSQKDIARG